MVSEDILRYTTSGLDDGANGVKLIHLLWNDRAIGDHTWWYCSCDNSVRTTPTSSTGTQRYGVHSII